MLTVVISKVYQSYKFIVIVVVTDNVVDPFFPVDQPLSRLLLLCQRPCLLYL